MEEEYHHLVRIKLRELLDKGDSNKIIWLRVVQITRRDEVDDGERFSGQRWKQQQYQRRGNITINNRKVRRAYNRK